MNTEIDTSVVGVHLTVRALEAEVEHATRRRALAFALANEKGKSTNDIASLLGITPMQALHIIRDGHRLLRDQRARLERSAA